MSNASEQDTTFELAKVLRKWVELADRTLGDHITRLDANRAVDFLQGIRETKDVLAKLDKLEKEPEPVEVVHEVCIFVENESRGVHYKLSFDADLENPKVEKTTSEDKMSFRLGFDAAFKHRSIGAVKHDLAI